jgi:hypothetical protein
MMLHALYARPVTRLPAGTVWHFIIFQQSAISLEPLRSLPPHTFEKHSALFFESLMKWAEAKIARVLDLL